MYKMRELWPGLRARFFRIALDPVKSGLNNRIRVQNYSEIFTYPSFSRYLLAKRAQRKKISMNISNISYFFRKFLAFGSYFFFGLDPGKIDPDPQPWLWRS